MELSGLARAEADAGRRARPAIPLSATSRPAAVVVGARADDGRARGDIEDAIRGRGEGVRLGGRR